MKLYRCNRCDNIWEEADLEIVRSTYEAEFGVASEFCGSVPYSFYVCPECGNDELYEHYEDEEEDEDEED